MAFTHELIATATVGAGGSSSINFTSIPGTYTDLLLVCSLRGNRADVNSEIVLRFNDSSSPYSNRIMYSSSSGSIGVLTNQNFDILADGSSNTANTFSSSNVYIPSYSSSRNKCYSVESVNESNASTAYQNIVSGVWSSSNPITIVKLVANGTNTTLITEGSTASLYGITKGSGGATVS